MNYSGCMDVFWSLFDISADLQCPDTAPVPVQSIHPTYQSCQAMHAHKLYPALLNLDPSIISSPQNMLGMGK